jgi:hypothetical protein
MKVKSLKTHPYGGRYHPKGSIYEMSKTSDVKVLADLKIVERVVESLVSKDIIVESPADEAIQEVAKIETPEDPMSNRQKRKYQRKDMVSGNQFGYNTKYSQ